MSNLEPKIREDREIFPLTKAKIKKVDVPKKVPPTRIKIKEGVNVSGKKIALSGTMANTTTHTPKNKKITKKYVANLLISKGAILRKNGNSEKFPVTKGENQDLLIVGRTTGPGNIYKAQKWGVTIKKFEEIFEEIFDA